MKIIIQIIIVSLLQGISFTSAFAKNINTETFEHLTTGFPLDGAHAFVKCETCHIGGAFKKISKNCDGCHTRGGNVNASHKSTKHIRSSSRCFSCHGERNWDVLGNIDHDEVIGNCKSCHNGKTAPGKTHSHPETREPCFQCHNTSSFSFAYYKHSGISGNCIRCHNNTKEKGKSIKHINSTNVCEACHTTRSWENIRRMDHNEVIGTCVSCHNGTIATGKHSRHFDSSNLCDECHNTLDWSDASFDHSTFTSATICKNCHNGKTAEGKNSRHFSTTDDCDECHNTRDFSAVTFRHTSSNYPGDHRGNLSCKACHTSNLASISWRYTAYKPDCAGCHAGDYEKDEHKNWSVSKNRDCAGTCHKSRPEHRVSDRDWD